MPQYIQFECKVTVGDDSLPYAPSFVRTFGKRAVVDLDVPLAAHELCECFDNLEIPRGRAGFLRSLFESWGKKMTKVMIRWLASLYEEGSDLFLNAGRIEEQPDEADWEA